MPGRALLVGDSQSVTAGAIAKRALQSAGYTVEVISNTGKGPYDYTRFPALWTQYTNAVQTFRPDIIVLIFGRNDPPNENLRRALAQMKTRVAPKVILTGPPMYLDQAGQTEGEAIRAMNQSVFGVDYFDAYPFTGPELPRAAPTPLFNPNPHFTPIGARPWGEAIAREVARRLGGSIPGGGGGTALGPPEGAGRLLLAAAGAATVGGLLWWLWQRPVHRNRRR